MSLRTPNDTQTIDQVLSAVQIVALPNTYQFQSGGSILINDDSSIDLGQAVWPVLFIQEAGAGTRRQTWYTWRKDKLHVRLTLLNVWQSQPTTIASLWNQEGLDLYRMQANLEDNPRLGILSGLSNPAGTPNAEAILSFQVSNRLEEGLDDRSYSFSVVKRWLDIELSLKPYHSGR